MFVQIYLRERKNSYKRPCSLKFLNGSSIPVTPIPEPGTITLEERSRVRRPGPGYQRIKTINYAVPYGYKYFETQHWIWMSTNRSFDFLD